MWATAYFSGLATGCGLIMAIGAQNAFVLTQAIRHNHAIPVAATCALIDVLLITAGVCGMGELINSSSFLRASATLGGAAFLLWFGAKSLADAFRPHSLNADAKGSSGLGPTLSATLAISLLNPHVYLDTVVMLGAVSTGFPAMGRYAFGAGAATASVIWFFGLSVAGAFLAPVFAKASAWRVLHLCVACMVWWVAAGLLYRFFS